jgi:hypothetical protein
LTEEVELGADIAVLEGLTSADWLLVALVCLWLPVQEWVGMPLSRRALDADLPRARLNTYSQSIAMLLLTAGAVLLVWRLEHRPLSDLGMRFDATAREIIGFCVAGAIALLLIFQLVAIWSRADAKAAFRAAVEKSPGVMRFMPRTSAEFWRFQMLSLTAGVTEEIVFRGFLIAAFASLVPLWAAALLALSIFVALHLYQGIGQLPGVLVAGTAMTALYLASGSLYPAIAAHVAIDIIQTTTWRVAMSRKA